jgi:hypothetical protein
LGSIQLCPLALSSIRFSLSSFLGFSLLSNSFSSPFSGFFSSFKENMLIFLFCLLILAKKTIH